MENQDKLSVTQRYKQAIAQFNKYVGDNAEVVGKFDGQLHQGKLWKLFKEFNLIKSIVQNLDLFSENESLDEVTISYIPFLNVEYYLAVLLQQCLINPNSPTIPEKMDPLEFKVKNLNSSKTFYMHYLQRLRNFNVLNNTQSSKLDNLKDSFNPTAAELITSSPSQRRSDKIENYRLEKQLREKLKILDSYYNPESEDLEDENSFQNLDEEIVKSIFIDELRLNSIKAFSALELIEIELQVISKRPLDGSKPSDMKSSTKPENSDEFGYTTRLETLPYKKKNIPDLISKQGKILQPFTITSDRNAIKKKVFGTGQVLPSMTVEEYLDYELANGKMAKESNETYNDSDTENSDDELENRRWDDWKDDNPKGSGNMKANLG